MTDPSRSVTPNAQTIPLRDPSTGACDGQLAVASKTEVEQIARRLRTAQVGWAALEGAERCNALLALADALERRREPMAQALLRDTGRWQESLIEVDSTVGALRRWAADAPALLQAPPPADANVGFITTRQQLVPYPLVGVISPWNFPLLLSLIDAIPALAAGCAVLCKPSEVTSRFVAVLDELLAEVPVLQQVFAVVTGGGSTGEAVIGVADTICFTGSVRTGRRVGEACAARFIPCSLELGGKDPAIVCRDADLDRAARGVVWGAFLNAGQTCVSVERVYVEEPVADAFIARVLDHARALRIGDPAQGEVEVGPLTLERQRRLVEEHVADAVARGARVLTGGRRPEGPGHFYPPTVLVDVDHGMRIMREETFGPVLPIMRVASLEEAIRLANDSPYGLTASGWTRSPESARRLQAELAVGMVSINDCVSSLGEPSAPYGGFKQSGIGRSHGLAGLREMVQTRYVSWDATRRPMLWWYPYGEELRGLLASAIQALHAPSPLRRVVGQLRMVGSPRFWRRVNPLSLLKHVDKLF